MRAAVLSAAALLAASPALAGGFSPVPVAPAPAAPVVVPVAPVASNDWGGFYAGLQLGTASGSVLGDTPDGEVTFFDVSGPFFGAHAGYMFDFGRLVAGVEVDYDMLGADLEANPGFGDIDQEYGTVDSVARLKARLGFDAGRVLPYVTAGIARASLTYDDPMLDFLLEDSADGNFVGLGASFLVRENIALSVEALRHSFDGPAQNGMFIPVEFSTDVDTVSLRGSFRF